MAALAAARTGADTVLVERLGLSCGCTRCSAMRLVGGATSKRRS